MMKGSIFYNCWATLITFTITFVVMVMQQSLFPSQILLWSFAVGTLTFVAMFGIRYLIGYILYTPQDELFQNVEGLETQDVNEVNGANSMNQQSTVEFNDETSEEIAKVVRTMMNYDNEPVTNHS